MASLLLMQKRFRMLVIDISINRKHHVTSIGAVRIEPKTDPENDTVCKYKVGRIYEGKIRRELGTVEHVYGDGAEELARKSIALVLRSGVTAIEEDNLERLLKIAERDTK